MHGAIPPWIVAEAIMIMAWKCLVFLVPFFVVAGLWWLVGQTDRIIQYLFPYLEWEQSLGWLNTKAERRTKMALCWTAYLIYALLAVALLGIVWGAEELQYLDKWSDPWVMGELALRVPVLVFCLGLWVLYLGGYLIPRLRTEREEAEWKKFQAELKTKDEAKKEREAYSRPRIHKPLPKPRKNEPFAPASQVWKRRRPPGE